MKSLFSFPTIFLVAGLVMLWACEGDDEDDFSLVGTETSVAALTGNWNATQGIFSSASAGPASQTDVVANGGSLTLNIQSDGRFTLTITKQAESPALSTGQLGFDEDLLVVYFDEDPDDFEFFAIAHNEPNLSISGGNGAIDFDFDGNGTDEPANVDFEFIRN